MIRMQVTRRSRRHSVSILLTSAVVLLLTPARGVTSTFLVPQPYSLNEAIAAAGDGDSILIAAGRIDRIPAAFSKRLAVIGLGTPGDPTVLAGLRPGRSRIENITFRPASPFDIVNLIEPTDSLTISNCAFEGLAATGILLDDTGAASARNLTILDCRFDAVNLAAQLDLAGVVPTRVRFGQCSFNGLHEGIAIQGNDVACPSPPAEPPPLNEAGIAVAFVDCSFDGITTTAVSARDLANAVSISGSTLTHYGTGLELIRAGGLVTSSSLVGFEQQGTGLHAGSSRFVIRSSQIRSNAIGVLADAVNGCAPGAGVIGGNQESSSTIAGNAINLMTSSPIEAEYNFWGSFDCETVMSQIVGQTVRIIVDENGYYPIDCLTPVQSSTWSGLKTRIPR